MVLRITSELRLNQNSSSLLAHEHSTYMLHDADISNESQNNENEDFKNLNRFHIFMT